VAHHADYNYADALAIRGWVAFHLDQHDPAAADFSAALTQNPNNRVALLGQAALALAAKDYAAAAPDLAAGINEDNRYGLGYVLRAEVEVAQAQPLKAVADLTTAQKLILYPDERALADTLLKQIRP